MSYHLKTKEARRHWGGIGKEEKAMWTAKADKEKVVYTNAMAEYTKERSKMVTNMDVAVAKVNKVSWFLTTYSAIHHLLLTIWQSAPKAT